MPGYLMPNLHTNDEKLDDVWFFNVIKLLQGSFLLSL